MPTEPMPNEHRTVSRVTAILELVAAAPSGGLTLQQIATALGSAKSSTHALLRGLVAKGYILQRSQGTYALGAATFALVASARQSIVELCRPALEALHAATFETVTLALAVHAELVYVDSVPANHPIIYSPVLHTRRAMWPTSCGKIFLAELDDPDLLRLTRAQAKISKAGRAELAQVRQLGFATNVGESVTDVAAVATGVRLDGRLVAAISIAGPRARVESRLPEFARQAIRECALLARRSESESDD